jgi:hypothetical protein
MKKEKVDRLKKKNQEEDVKAQIGVLLYVVLIVIYLLFLLFRLLFSPLRLLFVDRYKDANTYPGSTFFNRRRRYQNAQMCGKQRWSYQIGNSIGRQVEEEFQLRQISER